MDKLPDEIVERLLDVGKVEWGCTDEQSDEKHLAQFKRTLELTRENFNTNGYRAMHGVYREGENVVLCHTGTSPNSGTHANIIAGIWNYFVDVAEKQKKEYRND